jgi:hypothetical protein
MNTIYFTYLLTISLGAAAIWNGFKGKHYRRWSKTCGALIGSALLCIYIGENFTTIDNDGVLHEVPMMLPLSAFMMITGVCGVISIGILYCYRWVKNRKVLDEH